MITIDQHNEVAFGLQCILCKHRDPAYEAGCAAFPAGIPWDIARDDFDHSMPYPGDNGIRYEPLDLSMLKSGREHDVAAV